MLHIAFVAILLLQAPASWTHLGARQVGSRGDQDIIRTASEDRFKRIRLVVEGGDLELFDVSITFGDGKTFAPGGRFSFTGKSRSRVIAWPGGARVVRWINFYYSRPSGGRGSATVHVYGHR